MEEFIAKYGAYALLIVMIVEYLIGASKLKSNSTIDIVISIIKFIFQIEDKKLELPKE